MTDSHPYRRPSIKGDVSKVKCMFCMGLAGLFSALLVLLLIPAYSNYQPRIETGEIIGQLLPLQQQIADRIKSNGSLQGAGAGFEIPPDERIMQGMVADNGVVLVRGRSGGQLIVLMPELVEGEVSWRCLGGSTKDMPPSCRWD